MTPLAPLSREQFDALDGDRQFALFVSMREDISRMAGEIQSLRDQLSKNSRNSGKPPSSDGYAKPAPKSQRERGKRKSGGQPGHKGHTLRQVCDPDHVVLHRVVACLDCARDLDGVRLTRIEKRQVFDLPPARIEVTEHQGEVKRCPGCGSLARGMFPSEATQATQYGPGVRAVAAYLNSYQLLPLSRIVELFGDLFGHRPSESVILNASKRVYAQIRPSLDAIVAQWTAADVIHCDETGLRVDGKLCWLHTAGTPRLTWFAPHRRRGAEAMRSLGILPAFRGCAVHDGWKSYFTFDECAHALCNAHHLRELRFVKEQYGQTWAGGMWVLLREMHAVVKAAPPELTRLPREQQRMYERLYDVWLFRGKVVNPSPKESSPGRRGPRKQTPPKNLLDRLERYKQETLVFLRDFRVPFDNSLAERDIRMMKVKQKVSGCFRTWKGAEEFCAIRSYISTVRKQGHGVLRVIHDALVGEPFIPVRAGPAE